MSGLQRRSTGRRARWCRCWNSCLAETVEYDGQGRLVGSGITLRETPHAFVVNDQPLYTWCALDALMFPAVIGEPAQVRSHCPRTHKPVTLTVTPQEVLSLQPEDAVLSLVSVATEGDIRSAFCCDVHFFASRSAGEAWSRDRPDASIVTVQEGSNWVRVLPGNCSTKQEVTDMTINTLIAEPTLNADRKHRAKAMSFPRRPAAVACRCLRFARTWICDWCRPAEEPRGAFACLMTAVWNG
ncbi:alkylmercury lyase MerB [Marinobacter fonticola]|uniref:alkylmercury lyase MerB n=1 Tax=Marinobacter fonticola TaxID=2603215 RepID=UPI001D0DA416|nr:alkylmercury lyase MerB [Marinobacter fonticola]